MGGIGKCTHCINSYEEYGCTECRKDAMWLKFNEDEDIDDYADKYCNFYEEYPAEADNIPKELE